LADIPSRPEEDDFYRFKFKLPLGYFYERKEWKLNVECLIAQHNFVLRRSPVNMHNGTSYKYKIDSQNWVEFEKVEVHQPEKNEQSDTNNLIDTTISEKTENSATEIDLAKFSDEIKPT